MLFPPDMVKYQQQEGLVDCKGSKGACFWVVAVISNAFAVVYERRFSFVVMVVPSLAGAQARMHGRLVSSARRRATSFF